MPRSPDEAKIKIKIIIRSLVGNDKENQTER